MWRREHVVAVARGQRRAALVVAEQRVELLRAGSRGELHTGKSSSNSSRTPDSQLVIDQRAGGERVEDPRVDRAVGERRALGVVEHELGARGVDQRAARS